MNIIRCIVLGIVQGIGEFLPISSSAHLILVPYLLGWKESSMAFDIALHFGTLMAVLVIYFKDKFEIKSTDQVKEKHLKDYIEDLKEKRKIYSSL